VDVGAAVGVAVGADVGVAVGSAVGLDARIVRAKMLRLSTCAVAVDALKSTVVAKGVQEPLL